MNPEAYRQLFITESRERLGLGFELLDSFADEAPSPERLLDLMRYAHSIKGMAATMGYGSMVRLAHALEDLLQLLADGGRLASDPEPLIGDGLAALGAIVDAVERGGSTDSPAARAIAVGIRRELERAGDRSWTPGPIEERPSAAAPVDDGPRTRRYHIELELDDVDPVSGRDPTVRVLGNLASLGRVVGAEPPHLSGATGGFDHRLVVTVDTELPESALEELLDCLSGVSGHRLEPGQLPASEEADPGPPPIWLRVRADAVDVAIEESLELITELGHLPAPDAYDRLALLSRSLHERLRELRLVPFATITPRLQQAVHGLAGDLGKRCRLSLAGADARIDRAVLDGLIDPLVHLLRNAMDHGIESPLERDAAGKPTSGKILIAVEQHAERLRIVVEDDGRGLDVARLRAQAIERDLLDAQSAGSMSDEQLYGLISMPGFTTTEQVSAVSGRGLGVDIVRRAVEQLGGRLTIGSRPGRSTRFVLDLPANQALKRALVVRCGEHRFAVPSATIHKVVPLGESAPGQADPDWSQLTPQHLLDRLGLPRDERRPQRGLIVDGDVRRHAWLVDEIEGEHEVIVRPLGPPLDGLGIYDGAALTDEGSILLVVDPWSHA